MPPTIKRVSERHDNCSNIQVETAATVTTAANNLT